MPFADIKVSGIYSNNVYIKCFCPRQVVAVVALSSTFSGDSLAYLLHTDSKQGVAFHHSSIDMWFPASSLTCQTQFQVMQYLQCSLLASSKILGLGKNGVLPKTHKGIKGTLLYLCVLLILLSSDTEMNPGPDPTTHSMDDHANTTSSLCTDSSSCTSRWPCIVCNELCHGWVEPALGCDNCSAMYHRRCMGITSSVYNNIVTTGASWTCTECQVPNYS